MQYFMVLGAGEFQVPLIQAVKQKGMKVVVVSIPGDYPGFALADEVVHCDIRDRQTVLQAARKYNICGIATDQTDMAVPTVAYVAAQMGLPGMDCETALNFTDKSRMRRLCARLGLPTVRSREVKSLDEALEFYRELGREAIIKPVDSQGSRGVYRIDSEDTLRSMFEKSVAYSQQGQVVLEEFIHGQEMEINTMVVNGQVTTLTVADVIPFAVKDVFSSCQRLYPSRQKPEHVAALEEVNRRIVQGFGLQQGLTHGEYILDEQGRPYLVEIAARGGGNFVSSHMVPACSGLATEQFVMNAALHHRMQPPELHFNGGAGCIQSFYLPRGVVRSVEGVQQMDECPNVLVHSLHGIRPGMVRGENYDKTSRFTLVLYVQDQARLEECIDWVKRTVRVQVEQDGECLGPIWQ